MTSWHIEVTLHWCCRRVVFQPYTRQQLETIAKTRLEGLDVFESRAIEYAARKVHPHPACTCLLVTPQIACRSSCNQERSELHVAVGAHAAHSPVHRRSVCPQTAVSEARCIEQSTSESTSTTAGLRLIDALPERMPKQLNSKPRHGTCLCAQVAAVSGDVRRCLELLRRAAEITEAKTKQTASCDAAVASTSGQAPPTGHALPGIAPALLSHAVLAYIS
jgi:hypothetical protein